MLQLYNQRKEIEEILIECDDNMSITRMHPLIKSFEQLKIDLLTTNDSDWSERALELTTKLIDINEFRLAKNLLLVLDMKSMLHQSVIFCIKQLCKINSSQNKKNYTLVIQYCYSFAV